MLSSQEVSSRAELSLEANANEGWLGVDNYSFISVSLCIHYGRPRISELGAMNETFLWSPLIVTNEERRSIFSATAGIHRVRRLF